MNTRICPSGAGRACPTPELCLEGCNLQTTEGGRTYDSTVHEAPQVRRVPPVQFEPDYGGQRVQVTPWYARIPVVRWCAWICAFGITAFYIAGFVLRAINQFNR